MIDQLPRELVSQIFRVVYGQKLSRKDILQYRPGRQLVPCMEAISRVCWEWRRIVLNDNGAWTVVIRILERRDCEELGTQFKIASEILKKHDNCAVILSIDVGLVIEDEFYNQRVDLEMSSLLAICSTRVRGLEMKIYSVPLQFVILSLLQKLDMSDLELLYTDIYLTYDGGGIIPEGMELVSEAALSASILPNLEKSEVFRPASQNSAVAPPLCYAELQGLVCIRLLTQRSQVWYVQPTWSDLCGVIHRCPHLKTLLINLSKEDDNDCIPPNGIWLPCLKKCFLEATLQHILQFLSLKSRSLKYLYLIFLDANQRDLPVLMPSAVIGNDFSSIVYLALEPLCAVTAGFLSKAVLPSLATLIVVCSNGRNDRNWPSTIPLPALTTLKILRGNDDPQSMKLFLRGLSQKCETPSLLKSLVLDIKLSDEPDLMDSFSDAVFPTLVSLSIGRMADNPYVLAKFLRLMPSVEHLSLDRDGLDEEKTVLPHTSETSKSCAEVTLLQLRSLEVQFSNRTTDKNGYTYHYLDDSLMRGKDEDMLLEFVQNRFDSGIPLESLRVNPRLANETRARIENLGCHVEDCVVFPHRISYEREFDEL